MQESIGTEWDEKTPPLCPRCAYDLRGSPVLRCPECGYRPTMRELKEAAKATSLLMLEIEDLQLKLRAGYWVGGLGLAGGAFFRWVGLGGLGMIVGVFCGLGMMACGLQVFRAKRLRPEAQHLVSSEGDYLKGGLVAAVGLVMMVLSVLL